MSRKGTNIYKRKDGRWEARYVKSIELDGKKKYASVYGLSYCMLSGLLYFISSLQIFFWIFKK